MLKTDRKLYYNFGKLFNGFRRLYDNFNIPVIIRAINLTGKKKHFLVIAVFVFCAIELCCSTLYTFGIKGALNAVSAKDTGAFGRSVLLILSNHILWWSYAPFACYICARASKRTVSDFKTWMCEHIMRLPMKYLDKKPNGEFLSAITNDVDCLSQVYDWTFFQVLRSATGGVGGIAIMAVIDWRFAIVVVILGAVSVLVASHFSKKLEAAGKERQELLSKTCTDAYELVRAAKTIRLLKLQDSRKELYFSTTGLEADARIKTGKITSRMNSTINGISLVTYAVILFTGALFVYYRISDWGTVIALMGLKYATDMLFVECGQFMAEMQSNVAGIKRLFAIMDEEEETADNTSYLLIDTNEALEMCNVSFSYDSQNPVLSNFNLAIPKKGLTALAGESGSGKSTVMKLILGLYTPDSGRIIFGSGNSSDSYKPEVRLLTAYVPQEPALFRGTVLENILFGSPGTPREAAVSAARLAGADGFISSLENGYDTVLMDEGKSLSGGQRQRIAIARALVRDAPVLLLDEITSALDRETEASIFQTVRELSKSRSVLFITHRPDVRNLADKVICME